MLAHLHATNIVRLSEVRTLCADRSLVLRFRICAGLSPSATFEVLLGTLSTLGIP